MKIILVIPADDEAHYLQVTSLCFISIYDIESQSYSFHNLSGLDREIDPLPVFNPDEPLLVSNKKLFDRFFKNLRSFDLNTQYWLFYNKSFLDFKDYPIFNNFKRFYKEYYNWTLFTPYLKWVELTRMVTVDILKNDKVLCINEVSEYYSNVVYRNLGIIESAGLYIDTSLFNKIFNKFYLGNFVFCDYHLHTTTGRPSNTFDSVNFNALNKTDGSRLCFSSRFSEGVLVEFDLDAYHLRLIAQIINYPLPDESVHLYFGRKFFNKETLTEDEYQKSKGISFKLAYGGLTQEFKHVEFFQQMEELKSKLWQKFTLDSYLESPLSKRQIQARNFSDMNPSKLLNYLLQTLETEYSMIFIEEIHHLLKGKNSKLILYTYDSFLIDYDILDGKQLLIDIKNTLRNCRMRVGINYHELNIFNIPQS